MLTFRPEPPAKLVAPRYMASFRCTAEKCEDTCCAGAIRPQLSEDEVARLQTALSGSAEGEALLARGLERPPDLPEGAVASLSHPDGRCAFLNGGGRCEILARAAAGLPDDCVRYPRAFSALVGGRVEVAGRPGCPEMARLALESDEGLELVEAPPTISAVYPHLDPSVAAIPYGGPYEEIRDLGTSWLRGTAPLRVRLLSLADFGARVDGAFHREAASVDLEGLRAARAAVEAPGRQAELEALSGGDPSPAVMAVVANTMLACRPAKPHDNKRLEDLVTIILATYLEEAKANDPAMGQPGGTPLWEGVATAYGAYRARVAYALGSILDPMLARYCLNDWFRESYLGGPTVGARALLLLYRAALVRLCVVGHPGVQIVADEVIDGDPLDDRARAKVVKDALESIQIYARNIEGRVNLIRASIDLLPPGDLLARAAALAAFVG